MKKLILIILLCFSGSVSSQWQSTYGSQSHGDFDISNACGLANTVDQTDNALVAGCVEIPGRGNDIVLINYKPNGDTLWTRTYNGTANSEDKAWGIVVDTDGSIYITGMATMQGRASELILLKYSKSGGFLWARTIGETKAELDDMGKVLVIDKSRNICVTGFSTGKDGKRNILLVSYTPAGELNYIKTEDGDENLDSEGFGITVDAADNVYITGYTTTLSGLRDIITLKYKSTGTQLWAKTMNGPGSGNDQGNGVAVDGGGNIYVAGFVTNTGDTSSTDAIVIKYLRGGRVDWTDKYNGNEVNSTDKAWGIVVDDEDMIFMTGQTEYIGRKLDFLTIKYGSTGARFWQKTADGPVHGDDYATSIATMSNNKIVVAGSSVGTSNTFDFATVTYNSNNGSSPGSTRTYRTPNIYDDYAMDVAAAKNNKIYVTGFSEETEESSCLMFTVMTKEEEKDEITGNETALQFELSQNYPNPFNPSTTIGFVIPDASNVELVIYDLLGKVVDILVNKEMEAGSYNVSFTNSNLSSGIYFYELKAGNFRDVKKMTLVK